MKRRWEGASDPNYLSPDTTIIVVSDLHLGTAGEFQGDFLAFLQLLHTRKRDDLKNLQVLLITGDLFDMLLGNSIEIVQHDLYSRIFAELDRLQTTGILVLVTLGNHEISFTGDYHEKRADLIQRLKCHGWDYAWVDHLYDAVVMEDNPRGKPVLRAFNGNRDLLEDHPAGTFPLKMAPLGGKRFLFIHGHQFPWRTSKFSGALFWNRMIKKQAIYGDFLHFSRTVNRVPRLALREWKATAGSHEYRVAENILSKKEDQEVNEKGRFLQFLNVFKKSLGDYLNGTASRGSLKYFKRTNLFPVSHVIFGHTHKPGMTRDKYEHAGKNVVVANPGAWVETKTPTYLQIDRAGDLSLHEFDRNKLEYQHPDRGVAN